MSAIVRDVPGSARERFDLIVVGGGVYGAMLALEAVRRGMRPLVLDRGDFGAGTSFNNLRIIHGGLRYLQTLHMSRFYESVAERRWFFATFPELVRPLPCLMPLYGGVIRNSLVMRTALAVNDILSRRRNEGVDQSRHLLPGRVLSALETREQFPLVRTDGLKSAGLWYDGVVQDCHRIVVETLRWSVAGGGHALNYVEATGLVGTRQQVRGVTGKDAVTGEEHEFLADYVINAAGPWCRDVAARLDADRAQLFRASLAWNVLLDRPPLSDGAVAVQPPKRGGRVFFAHSLGGRLFVGTGHSPVTRDDDARGIPEEDIASMLDDLNQAVPGLDLGLRDIVRLFSGRLPVKATGTVRLSDRPVIYDHVAGGGPRGLLSLSGVKYTTARSTAEKVISRIVADRTVPQADDDVRLTTRPQPNDYELNPVLVPDREKRIEIARRLIATEAPQKLEDLVIRRSNLVAEPDTAIAVAADCCSAFEWDASRRSVELESLKRSLARGAQSDV